MLDVAVSEGALFYGETRRRFPVVFDERLRALTACVAAETRTMLAAGRTPPPIKTPACQRCSLADACQPDRLVRPPSVDRWLASQLDT